ncbi:unnamed protein product [Bursaphelenchus xylophilus]|uniref:(pine wood nematode) hypothetical protein n=1 Tax=Bursaphelenchus xylophilus TaxID=6326 RepID=A0A1I7RQG1_BURXY|nr:unnamed protein product [Bursaphelenchus xylophilus]CAG9104515.1 unnamed protein product [Bursaphelenchus xylophilus]
MSGPPASPSQVSINIDLDAAAAIQQRILQAKPTLSQPPAGYAPQPHPSQPTAPAKLTSAPTEIPTSGNVQVDVAPSSRQPETGAVPAQAGVVAAPVGAEKAPLPGLQQHSPVASDQRRDSGASNTGRKGRGYKAKRVFKVIIIGDAGVGKTCLSFRFCNNRFPQQTEATIGVDFRERTLPLEGELIRVQLWDTAGQERYRQSIVAHYYRNVNAVVFVYDVNSPKSFKSLPLWINECKKHGVTSDEVPHILIGNKVDLSAPNRVRTDEAQVFADQNDMALFETSALSQSEADHVEAIFMTLVHKLQQCKPMHVQTETERHQREEKLLLKASDLKPTPDAEGWCC